MQRFISDSVWDEEQMVWNYHQLVAAEMGDRMAYWMFDESGFVKKAPTRGGESRGSTVAPWGRSRIVRSGCSRGMPRAMAMPSWKSGCSCLRRG